ncbi:hypothetical protein FOZ62_005455, partial [Perkinsus olseni]
DQFCNSNAVLLARAAHSMPLQNMLSIPDDDFMDCLSVVTSSCGETEVAALARQVSGQFDEMTQTLFVAARSAQAEILQYLTSEGASEFTSLGNAGAVEITARPPPGGGDFQVMMGRRSFGVGEVGLDELLDTLMDPASRPKYNTYAAGGEILRKGLIDEPGRRLDLQYATFKGMLTLAGRDCVYAILCERVHENLWVVSWKSMDIPAFSNHGRQSGLVRCNFLCCGYALMVEPQTGELIVTMVNQADPGGNVRKIPTWIANKVQRGQPASLNNLYDLLKLG